MLLAVLGLLLCRRDFRLAAWVGLTMGFSLALTLVLKNLFGRNRPPTVIELGQISGSYAFPSGHTTNTTVLFGLLALLAAVSWRQLWARLVVLAGWLLVCVAVALSRIYLGYHWLTDVVGGFGIGVVILAVAVLMPTLVADRRLERQINPFIAASVAGERPETSQPQH